MTYPSESPATARARAMAARKKVLTWRKADRIVALCLWLFLVVASFVTLEGSIWPWLFAGGAVPLLLAHLLRHELRNRSRPTLLAGGKLKLELGDARFGPMYEPVIVSVSDLLEVRERPMSFGRVGVAVVVPDGRELWMVLRPDRMPEHLNVLTALRTARPREPVPDDAFRSGRGLRG